MRAFILTMTMLAGALASAGGAAAQEAAMTFDEKVNSVFASSTGWFVNLIFAPLPGTSFPWIVMWLVVGATVFTLYFGFIQLRAFGHAISLVKGDYSDPNDAGEVSHFQALATALSGTVGLGNIAGVAVAVGIGGPGATFWMIIAGLLGMASKFTECTLGVKYRNEFPDGHVSGGPMYYMTKGFKERGLAGGGFLAVLFSIFCILGSFGGGNMFQSNQAHAQLTGIFGDYPGWITGVIFAVIVFAVIIGGIKSIAQVTEKIVPFMGVLYVGTALLILADQLPSDRLGLRADLRRRLHGTGRRRRSGRRADPGLQAGGVLQRGGRRIRRHRPFGGPHQGADHRGRRLAARAVHRHGGDLHHDRAGHHHLGRADGRPGDRSVHPRTTAA